MYVLFQYCHNNFSSGTRLKSIFIKEMSSCIKIVEITETKPTANESNRGKLTEYEGKLHNPCVCTCQHSFKYPSKTFEMIPAAKGSRKKID